MNRRGQVTLFIIIAIIVVVGILSYFFLRDRIGGVDIPVEFVPVYEYYLNCLEETSRQGISLLGEQGGYIETPEFEPGSSYMPFSSQLDFLGQGVPYWMYVSGNNLLKEQVPTKKGMERELGEYLGSRVQDCDFTNFELAGFDVYVDEGIATTSINDFNVKVEVSSRITMFRGNSSAIVSNHNLEVDSKLGRFYKLALDVFNFEKSDAFLEKYAVDVMRLYAPVDGAEISCAPKIFVDEEIREDIVEGLVSNVPVLKLKGDYYDLTSKEQEYFVTDIGYDVKENVNFMYSPDWPTRIEIYGDKVAKPIGLQEGLGILGFCYLPYHLVYDINFPVMVQFYDTEELFQFPVAVIVDKSHARSALPTTSGALIESKVCEFKNQEVEVYTYDVDLNPVEAQISFKCLDSVCQIGDTAFVGDEAILVGGFPQCVNGFIVASAEGYKDAKYQISTNEEGIANIVMDKKYEIGLDLGNVGKAIVSFSSDEYSTTILYPDMNSVELVEGYYDIKVYVHDTSSLKFPGINERRCVDIPAGGVSGFLGAETEKCFDYNIPPVDIDFALVGGGSTKEYITVEQLKYSNEININVPLFGPPRSLEDLQENNILVEGEVIYLDFE
jgi:hypothetical protein